MRRRTSLVFLAIAGVLYLGGIVQAGLSSRPVASDLAVVLGNEVLKSGKPSVRLQARLDCAADIFRRHLARALLVSGGVGKSGFDEATVMKQYLVSQGIPAGAIFSDHEGVNTMATAINTARLAKATHFSRIIIVTQYYHIARAILAFHKVGLVSLSADYPRYFELWDLAAIVREAIALPVYFTKMPNKEFM